MSFSHSSLATFANWTGVSLDVLPFAVDASFPKRKLRGGNCPDERTGEAMSL